MILNKSQFTGPINIIGIHDTGASSAAKVEDLNSFIAIYEPIYLNKILGSELVEKFSAFLGNPTEEERWVKLKAILEKEYSPLARYVYFFYIRTKAYQTSSTGTFSEGTSPKTICVQTWNDNINSNKMVYELVSSGDYEGFEFNDELIRPIW